jgi:hypothetical protein
MFYAYQNLSRRSLPFFLLGRRRLRLLQPNGSSRISAEQEMGNRVSVIGACVGACFLAFSAPAHAQLNVNIVISAPPPAPIVEAMPAPRVGYVWAPGFWEWDGYQHVWLPGHWEGEREGEFYAQARWVQAAGGWRLLPGHWEQREHSEDNDEHGEDHDRHGGHFCPPGQAKKGNC